MRGRKSEAPATKRLKGTRKPATASTVVGLPPSPFPLSAVATAHYERLGKLLIAKGRLAESDADALALYASTAALLERADAAIKRNGFTTKGGSGGLKANPALTVRKACLDRMTSILSLFGCTPADRNRLGVTEAVPVADRLSAFLEGKASG